MSGPQLDNCKSGGPKKSNDKPITTIGRISPNSYQLGLLLGVMEFTILCAFVCKVGYFDAQIRLTPRYKEGGLTYSPLWGEYN